MRVFTFLLVIMTSCASISLSADQNSCKTYDDGKKNFNDNICSAAISLLEKSLKECQFNKKDKQKINSAIIWCDEYIKRSESSRAQRRGGITAKGKYGDININDGIKMMDGKPSIADIKLGAGGAVEGKSQDNNISNLKPSKSQKSSGNDSSNTNKGQSAAGNSISGSDVTSVNVAPGVD